MKEQTKILSIDLHSFTDLITNSSTVIFTYSNGCIEPLKDMINEILKTFNSNLTCDDMFNAVVLCTDEEQYYQYLDDLKEKGQPLPFGLDTPDDFEKVYTDVKSGKIEKPDWFTEVENSENSYDYYTPSTRLFLIPKDEKYLTMGRKIINFLYSTNHEATRDG